MVLGYFTFTGLVNKKREESKMSDLVATTKRLQTLLDGAGVITIPAGEYLTGPLEVRSNTKLILEKGAVIKFISDPSIYEPVFSRWEGVKCYCMHPCLFINEAHDVEITGEGVIDGNGSAWWAEVWRKKSVGQNAPESEIEKKFASLNPGYETQPGGGGGRPCQFLRPSLIQIKDSYNVKLEGVTVQNSPFWTIHPVFSQDLVIKNVTVKRRNNRKNTHYIIHEGTEKHSLFSVPIIHRMGVDNPYIIYNPRFL